MATGAQNGSTWRLRIAAAGDIHCREGDRAAVAESFAEIATTADLVLLAGDLTAHGEPAEAEVLADACAGLDLPIATVLGNHECHRGRAGEISDLLTDAGLIVLQRAWTIIEIDDVEVGIVGTKGFIGGFGPSQLPDFGEELLRQVYAETTAEVEALEEGLAAVAECPVRIALLHYAPTTATLEGEREDIWTFLGSERLAGPLIGHSPDLVLHGHAHAGRFRGAVGEVPVLNVSRAVLGADFWTTELSGPRATKSAIH